MKASNPGIIINLVLILLLSGFVLLKIQDLFLPYFWDEAWSYFPAIMEMVKNGPSLVPGSISPELYRGHPLLFYFLSSTWITLFGSEIWITKLFPLITSIVLVLAVFYFSKKHFDNQTAFLTIGILMIQSVFFAQSAFLLPEILLTLFTVLSLHAWLNHNRYLTILWLTLALYTKESGIIIWMTISIFEWIEITQRKDRRLKEKVFNLLYLLIPLFMIAVFFIAQKIIVGWFLFPGHIASISLDAFFDRLSGYCTYLFIYMGRNMLTLFGLLTFILLLVKKDKALYEKKKVLYILSFFIVLYLLFSSLNFYSPRYLLTILPFTILIWVYFIKSALKKYHVSIAILVFGVVIFNNLYFTITKRGGHDHTLGYRDLIYVHSEMVSYCQENKLEDRNIYTRFLMVNNLTNTSLGYLKGDATFRNVSSNLTPETEYAIFSSDEFDRSQYESIRAISSVIRRFEKNECWAELIQLVRQ